MREMRGTRLGVRELKVKISAARHDGSGRQAGRQASSPLSSAGFRWWRAVRTATEGLKEPPKAYNESGSSQHQRSDSFLVDQKELQMKNTVAHIKE